jgi:fluoroacetyl-CoA thioesterase
MLRTGSERRVYATVRSLYRRNSENDSPGCRSYLIRRARQDRGGGVDVLSTPMLLQLVEEAAIQCIAPALEEDEITLATHVDLTHLSATAVGLIVRTEVEVLKFDGKRVEYAFTAFDEREKIAEGTHERYVTSREKFRERLEDKLG